jgi:hypothetical protein
MKECKMKNALLHVGVSILVPEHVDAKNPDAVAKLIEAIDVKPDSETDPVGWVKESIAFGYEIIGISGGGSFKPSGFLSFDRMLQKDVEDGKLIAKCSYSLKHVFVRSDCRGAGHGRALRNAFLNVIDFDLSVIHFRGLAEGIRFSVEAECISEFGADFTRKLVVECEKIAERRSTRPVDGEVMSVCFRDFVDYGDWDFGPAAVALV